MYRPHDLHHQIPHAKYVCALLCHALCLQPPAYPTTHNHKADHVCADRDDPAYRIGQIQRLRCMELLVYAEKCKYPQLPGILGAWSVIPIISRPIDAAYFAFSVTVLYACPLETV